MILIMKYNNNDINNINILINVCNNNNNDINK